MKQTTAKNRAEVLHWMENNGHHIADATDPKFFVLQGYHAKLRIPNYIHEQLVYGRHFAPGSFFDTRMYRPTKQGRRIIRKAGLNGDIVS